MLDRILVFGQIDLADAPAFLKLSSAKCVSKMQVRPNTRR